MAGAYLQTFGSTKISHASPDTQTCDSSTLGPNSLRICYIGTKSGTSLQRGKALERLGHSVSLVDPSDWMNPWMRRWARHAGGYGVGLMINRPVFNAVRGCGPDLIWVDQGDYVDARLISGLRSLSVPIVNYTIDDPFGGRDGRRFNNYLGAMPFYDFLAVVREETLQRPTRAGRER